MKTKLIGSAPTMDTLIDLIKSKMYWKEVSMCPLKAGLWVISPAGKISDSPFRVKIKGKRFRLEMIVD